MPQFFGGYRINLHIPPKKKNMRNYFHYCSKGLERAVLFKDTVEFIAGVNRIAVCYLLSSLAGKPIKIISFCLMDNHFHFVLYGEEQACSEFVDRYKKLTLMWISKHRGVPLEEEILVGHWPIPWEKVHEKIAYLHRNPIAAGFKQVPYFYRWSSASLLFSGRPDILDSMTKASQLSAAKKERIFYSRIEIPDNWLIDKDGMVWPGCFVDIRLAEKQFQSVGSYMFDMNNGNIDKECDREMLSGNIMLPDGDIIKRAESLADSLLGLNNLNECSLAERISLATLLKKEMGCNSKQLARVFHLKPHEVKLIV